MDNDAIDARLSALLGAPNPAPDAAFIARIARAVAVERALATARARAWRRFGGEALATGGVAGGLLLLWRFAPAIDPQTMLFGPAAAGPLALLLWLVVGMRPAGAGQ